MALKSSYIFLPTRNAVEQSKSTRVFTLIRKISKVLQNEFLFADQCVTYDNNLFKCSIKFSLTLETVNFDVDILINQVVDKIYVDVTINYFSKEENVCYMEYVNEKIVNIGQGLSNDYVLIITYDAVSEYYCNKIYPELNKLERNLRKLLFNIYILNFGQDYYTETIKPEIQNKIKARVKAKGNEGKKEIERIKQFFYSLEYSEIQLILFEEKWTSLDEKKKNDFLIQNSDLAKLEDSYLRKVIEDISHKFDFKIIQGEIERTIQENQIYNFDIKQINDWEFDANIIDIISEAVDRFLIENGN